MSTETNEKYNLRIVTEKLQVQLWLRERFFLKKIIINASCFTCLFTDV